MDKNFYTVKGYQLKEQNLLTSSMEDHLEMIYRLFKEKDTNYVRVNQLAEKLNLRPSSTSKIIQKLSTVGLIKYKPYGVIELTLEGEKWGDFLLTRHEVIQSFSKNIGVNQSLLKDTEMMEHYIGIESL